MTPLGKQLVLYLKYMAEMNCLYGHAEGEEPDLTGLEDAEHVQEMARTVGAAASEQAADFLELCGKRIDDHFTGLGIATLTKKTKRATLVKNWWWRAEVRVPSVPDDWIWCGVWVTAPPDVRITLANDTCGVVVPWLWSKEAVRKILGGWADPGAGEGFFDDKGTVALARIPIKAQPPESFDVDRDPLIAEVMKTIARIGTEQTKAIASAIARLKEADET